ncbi:hypothetical protein QWY85_17180 [Neolewinella lacunae]|uniref:Uracil-DNA glycosylase-like domain-containing protein n=1 Tax=Neolewinella lacunae TaxID=1517758 RepID=A0A923T8R1_9BACT|nr:uracil-DNA glycosylase family protein [Neolewinella lacunae]MBC6995905.1 hypothetical protein [Neolewinella lacunae]MDN3636402.1 hypothetical protein [Neolewinella lacunae]
MNTIPTAYRHLLETIASKSHQFSGKQLVAFHPMRGPGEAVDTMYIGRALNGWHWEFTVKELQQDLEGHLQRILEDKHVAVAHKDRLDWVEKYWQNSSSGYNTAKSQFWQVIRQISRERNQAGEQWWDDIVWTNFFKIAPAKMNPTGKMVKVMGQASHELLLAEIAHYQPRNIVCLSGLNYAAHLLASANATIKIPYDGSVLEYVGDVSWAEGEVVRLIVAPHPQSRSATKIAEEVKSLLKNRK